MHRSGEACLARGDRSQHLSMPHPRPLPESLPDHGFTVRDAHARGVTRRRLRARDLDPTFHGVRSRGDSADPLSRAMAYSVKLRDGEALSHGTALLMCGVSVPADFVSEIHVTSLGTVERARGAGARGHEAAAGSLRVIPVDGVAVIHPVDAWCQLGAALSLRQLVVLGDALTRRKRPIATRDELRRASDRHAGKRGVRRLRRAVELVRERTDSNAETGLRLDAADYGLPEPEVNGAIVDERGRLVAYGDLVYRPQRTILEFDGDQHRTDDRQFARDLDRMDELARLGWRIVRVTRRHDLPARRAKLALVRAHLIERGWSPNPR